MREVMLTLHFIGVAMVLGSAMGYTFLGMQSKKFFGEELRQFVLHIFPLHKMLTWGLVVNLISGGYLMTGRWASLVHTPLLLGKIILYLALGAVAGLVSARIRKVKKGNDKLIPGFQNFGHINLALSLIIVILAVLVFN